MLKFRQFWISWQIWKVFFELDIAIMAKIARGPKLSWATRYKLSITWFWFFASVPGENASRPSTPVFQSNCAALVSFPAQQCFPKTLPRQPIMKGRKTLIPAGNSNQRIPALIYHVIKVPRHKQNCQSIGRIFCTRSGLQIVLPVCGVLSLGYSKLCKEKYLLKKPSWHCQ